MNTNTEHASPALFAAIAEAQGEIENASKNAANPHFKSKYADLAEILNTTRPVFAKHGLSLSQFPGFDGALASVTTIIAHKEGGYIVAVASCVPAKSDAQGIGSATTYLRRYSAAAAAGIAQEDDDGESAKHDSRPVPVGAVKRVPNTSFGVWEGLEEETRNELGKLAITVREYLEVDDGKGALEAIGRAGLDNEEKAGLWTRFTRAECLALKHAAKEAA
jgi:hypothetical protein